MKFSNYLIYSNFDFWTDSNRRNIYFNGPIPRMPMCSPARGTVRTVRILNQGGPDQGPDQRPDKGPKSVSGCRCLIWNDKTICFQTVIFNWPQNSFYLTLSSIKYSLYNYQLVFSVYSWSFMIIINQTFQGQFLMSNLFAFENIQWYTLNLRSFPTKIAFLYQKWTRNWPKKSKSGNWVGNLKM